MHDRTTLEIDSPINAAALLHLGALPQSLILHVSLDGVLEGPLSASTRKMFGNGSTQWPGVFLQMFSFACRLIATSYHLRIIELSQFIAYKL